MKRTARHTRSPGAGVVRCLTRSRVTSLLTAALLLNHILMAALAQAPRYTGIPELDFHYDGDPPLVMPTRFSTPPLPSRR